MTAMLDREFQTFQKHKPNLVKNHAGKFVLIKEDEIIGIFENELDAVILCAAENCVFSSI